jgi:hypothetical protein
VTLASGAAARMLARFTGRLTSVTLTRPAQSTLDASDPTAAPTGTATTYAAEGLAFTYAARDIDGTRIMKGDYRVVLLRAADVLPEVGDLISVPPPGSTTARTARVIAVEAVTDAQVTLQVRG